MPTSTDDGAWLDPKWLVIGFALAAFGLIASYDWRLGLAAGALLGLAGLTWLALALRYRAGPPTARSRLVELARQHARNRRLAAARVPVRSSAQQPPQPPQRP